MRHHHEAEGKPKPSSVAAGQRGGFGRWMMGGVAWCLRVQRVTETISGAFLLLLSS